MIITSTPEPVVWDLGDGYESSTAESLPDSRIRIDLSTEVVLIGTAAELLDFASTVESHTRSIVVEQERADRRAKVSAA